MITEADILSALRGVRDPEMPINIVDLGLVERVQVAATPKTEAREPKAQPAHVFVDILPTFVGCPALDMIRDNIRDRLLDLPGVVDVTVRFLNNPLWSTDRITPAGRASLRRHGVTVPPLGAPPSPPAAGPATLVPLTVSAPRAGADHACGADHDPGAAAEAVACPFCGSDDTTLESRFGPTRCRMIYYCNACRNSFERLKRI